MGALRDINHTTKQLDEWWTVKDVLGQLLIFLSCLIIHIPFGFRYVAGYFEADEKNDIVNLYAMGVMLDNRYIAYPPVTCLLLVSTRWIVLVISI